VHHWPALVVLQDLEQDQDVCRGSQGTCSQAQQASGPRSRHRARHGQILCYHKQPRWLFGNAYSGAGSRGPVPRFLMPDAVLDYIETNGLYPALIPKDRIR